MLKIRLRRMGSRHRPFYRVVVSESRRTPTASALEEVGYYDPRKKPAKISIDFERVEHWMSQGAQPSSTVRKLVAKARAMPAVEPEAKAEKAAEPEAKAEKADEPEAKAEKADEPEAKAEEATEPEAEAKAEKTNEPEEAKAEKADEPEEAKAEEATEADSDDAKKPEAESE
ncbi:MAG: 30S ribosomal protein S16 [bacterium]|nr:30S ribosomal protein S16 [bacterium]